MEKLNATEKKTMVVISKSGFTFKGDAHFKSFRQATNVLNRLERIGYVQRIENQFVFTNEGRWAA